MSQALYNSMTGIKAPQSQLSVISNNIANINTTGFKASSVNFEDVYYNTTTSGSGPSKTTGGTNPIQSGLGVQVSGIAKNFEAGTYVATGSTTDLMIQGNGFFTVMDSSGQMYLTRAGDFSFDANGDLVNPSGYKVCGANSLYSTTGSDVAVHVPTSINATVEANANFAGKNLSDLNADVTITTGTFTINVTDAAGATTAVGVTIDSTDNTMNAIAAKITTALTDAGFDDVTVNCDNTTGGTIQFKLTDTTNKAASLEFSSQGATSNFVEATQLGSASLDPATDTYTSQVMDYTVDIEPINSYSNATSVSSYSIADDGSIEATYSDGSKLTVELNENDNTFQFKYTTNTNVVIRGTDANVNVNVATPESFVLQIASVVNQEGLVSKGSNLYMTGPNSGQMVFTVASAMGMGSINSGGLESSNVDMAKEFSNMILAQRAIQANSRVFDTASSVLENLSYLGR